MERRDVINALKTYIPGTYHEIDMVDYLIDFLENPLDMLTMAELINVSHKYEHIVDVDDIKQELEIKSDFYENKYGLCENPIDEYEIDRMAYNLRDILDEAYGEAWSGSCEVVIRDYLSHRNKERM